MKVKCQMCDKLVYCKRGKKKTCSATCQYHLYHNPNYYKELEAKAQYQKIIARWIYGYCAVIAILLILAFMGVIG